MNYYANKAQNGRNLLARARASLDEEENKKSEETKEDKNIVILAVISEIVTRIDHCICRAYG